MKCKGYGERRREGGRKGETEKEEREKRKEEKAEAASSEEQGKEERMQAISLPPWEGEMELVP